MPAPRPFSGAEPSSGRRSPPNASWAAWISSAPSGAHRITPLFSVHPDDDTWLIAASKAGAPEHPAWYHNLRAHPEVEIETPDDDTVAVRAEVLVGADRDEAYRRFTAHSDGFRHYQQRTARVIPVIALRRR
jgi:deazaflavin-dependent oxidoreductase (nitroreductase family)